MLTRDEFHVYRKDGVIVPGVTTVMGNLHDYGCVPQWALEYASERGRNVHTGSAIIDRGQEIGSIDPRCEPYLDAWKLFTQREKPEWAVVEQMLFDPVRRFAGEPDRAGWVFDGYNIIDIKCTVDAHPAHGVQLAAYQLLCEAAAHFDSGSGRFVVQLKPDGKYVVHQYKDPMDTVTFLSCLAVYNWKERNRVN